MKITKIESIYPNTIIATTIPQIALPTTIWPEKTNPNLQFLSKFYFI